MGVVRGRTLSPKKLLMKRESHLQMILRWKEGRGGYNVIWILDAKGYLRNIHSL